LVLLLQRAAERGVASPAEVAVLHHSSTDRGAEPAVPAGATGRVNSEIQAPRFGDDWRADQRILSAGVIAEPLGSLGPAMASDQASGFAGPRLEPDARLAGRDPELLPGALRSAMGLDITEAWMTDDGDAVVIAIDSAGDLQVLTVHASADLADTNGDGVLSRDDLDAFLLAYANGAALADADMDGVVEEVDLQAYLRRWAASSRR